MTARTRQGGISLLTVIVLVLLSGLLALWASRSALFHELVVGNAADHQRAQEAAEALLQDAQHDLALHHASGIHPRAEQEHLLLPADSGADFDVFVARLQSPTAANGCRHGLCMPRSSAIDFWLHPPTLAQMTQAGIGARYGDYTQAPAANHHPLLTERNPGRGGWYWIEVLRHQPAEGGDAVWGPNVRAPLLYRITALAQGLKAGSQVVLQTVVAFPAIAGE